MQRSATQNRTFRWLHGAREGAKLVAEGHLTYRQIAKRLKVDVATVWRWRRHPTFQARVDALLAEIRAEVRRVGISVRARRIAALNDRWERMWRIIHERAADPVMQDVPGGTTGLLVRRVKRLGSGDQARDVAEYRVDTKLLREMRKVEQQAAIELGQWRVLSEADAVSRMSNGHLMRLVGVRRAV